jgi:nitrogen regulatory protein P-II 1
MPEAGYRMLLLIARNEDAFDPLITGLLDVGITGATIIESRGIGAVIREDMPFFAGLAALLPQHTGSRMLVSVTTPDRIEGLLRYFDQLRPEQRPVGAVLPVEAVIGFGH